MFNPVMRMPPQHPSSLILSFYFGQPSTREDLAEFEQLSVGRIDGSLDRALVKSSRNFWKKTLCWIQDWLGLTKRENLILLRTYDKLLRDGYPIFWESLVSDLSIKYSEEMIKVNPNTEEGFRNVYASLMWLVSLLDKVWKWCACIDVASHKIYRHCIAIRLADA